MGITYDTIVVGGGTAGAAVAGRLAERGNESVLLLEAGPDYGKQDNGRWPTDLLDGRVLTESHDWGYTSASRTGLPRHRLPRAKVIGGCSSHNGCIALCGSRSDYDGWAEEGNPGWSADDLLPFFNKAAAMLRVREFTVQEVTPFHAACLEAMEGAGIPLTDRLDDLDENVGAATAPVNIENGVRRNTAAAYLDPVRGNPQLTILGDAQVEKINIVKGRAASVEVIRGGSTTTMIAGRVVLCAGAYGSPAVLMRSGVGTAEALRALGIPPVLDLPGVGCNLHDHPAIELTYIGAESLSEEMHEFASNGQVIFTEQSLAKARSSHCDKAFDLHLYPCSSAQPDEEGKWGFVLPVANMVPRSRGRVTLQDRDASANLVIDTGYLNDAQDVDLDVLMDGVALTRRVAAQPSLARFVGQERPGSKALAEPDAVRRSCCHYYHPVGSCKMGPSSDPLAVVDASGMVHGIENITVVDASIMPTIPRANTNLPVLALAERIVSQLN
jgi:choline dehydrogenase